MSFAIVCQNLRRATTAALVLGVGAALLALSGCSRPYGVPYWNTSLVGEAPSGNTASFSAPDEGTVWVDGPGHNHGRHIVYSGLITRGQTLTLDGGARQLMLDGKPVNATITESNASMYQIWFQPIRHDLLAP
jgi:hypothetical protein